MVVINLWGAPSSGKSTTAAGLFFLLKINKHRTELVTEFAKELVWDGRENMFGDQMSIYAEQNRRLRRLEDHIEFAVTDSPLPLPAFYQPDDYLAQFKPLVFEQFHRYNNINYFLRRKHSFEAIGRRHDEAAALRIEQDLQAFMNAHGLDFQVIDANPQSPQTIFDDLMRRRAPTVAMPLKPAEN